MSILSELKYSVHFKLKIMNKEKEGFIMFFNKNKAATTGKQKKKMPHTYVIIFIIILLAVALTWIVPAGEYFRFENEQGIKVIDPQQFSYIASSPVNPFSIGSHIVEGFISNIDLLLVILFAGGAFHLITLSGAVQASIAKVAKKFSSKLGVFIPILTTVFALICTMQGVNLFIAFAPITVMISMALGLDSIVGAAIILLGGAVGFSTGTLQISTTVLSQKIAGLPLYSGIGFRWVCFFIFLVVTNIYLVRYAKRIKENPMLSPMYDLDKDNEFSKELSLDDFGQMTIRRWLVLAALIVTVIAIVYGGIALEWELADNAAAFIWLSIAVGFLAGFSPSEIAKEFTVGCKKMLSAAIIIGLARSIGSILTEGHIIDTIVHFLATALNYVPSFLQGTAMFISNIIINCFITSGSGQASVVMPIMVPIADLIGMTRQTAVLAFNFGDGFCNYILPTSTALMGILGAANVPYDRWMKFMWKLFVIWLVLGSIMLMIAQAIQLGPM